MTDSSLRIGQGYDIHPLAMGRKLLIGGVEIPTEDGRGTLGHSDGDPLLHALIDAILGSRALGDIGNWFPDKDSKWKDANSADLLNIVLDDPRFRGWSLVNLDCTVVLATPKLGAFIPEIQANLAKLLKTTPDRISIKAKSNNGIATTGQGDAIAAMVTLLAMLP